jgi:hypothetical protein
LSDCVKSGNDRCELKSLIDLGKQIGVFSSTYKGLRRVIPKHAPFAVTSD